MTRILTSLVRCVLPIPSDNFMLIKLLDQPFEGMAVSQAAFTFIYRFMANHSAEYPEGRLTQGILKNFFSITGDRNNVGIWLR